MANSLNFQPSGPLYGTGGPLLSGSPARDSLFALPADRYESIPSTSQQRTRFGIYIPNYGPNYGPYNGSWRGQNPNPYGASAPSYPSYTYTASTVPIGPYGAGVQHAQNWLNQIDLNTLNSLPSPDNLAPCVFNVHVQQPQYQQPVQPPVQPPSWTYNNYAPQYQTNMASPQGPPQAPMPPGPPPMPQNMGPMEPPPIEPTSPTELPHLPTDKETLIHFPNGQSIAIEEAIHLYRQLQQIQKYFHSTHITRRQNAAVNLSLLLEHYPSLYEPPKFENMLRDIGNPQQAQKLKQFIDRISQSAVQMSLDVLKDEASEVRFPMIVQYKVGNLSYLPPIIERQLDMLANEHGMYNFEPSHIMAIKRRFNNGRPRWDTPKYDSEMLANPNAALADMHESASSNPIPEPTDWTPTPQSMQPTSKGSQIYPVLASHVQNPVFNPGVQPIYKRQGGGGDQA